LQAGQLEEGSATQASQIQGGNATKARLYNARIEQDSDYNDYNAYDTNVSNNYSVWDGMDRVDPGMQSTWHVTRNHRLIENNLS
jgi:hypothetical protein